MGDVINIRDGSQFEGAQPPAPCERIATLLNRLNEANQKGLLCAVVVATVNADGSNSKAYAVDLATPPSAIIGSVELLKDFCINHIVAPRTVVGPPEGAA